MKKETKDELLLRLIISAFTKHPENLEFKSDDRGVSTVISLWAHRSDLPKIIGGVGKHLQALRTIFLYIGKREGRRISIIPNEPKIGAVEFLPPFANNPDWLPDNAIAVIRAILDRILLKSYTITPVGDAEQTILTIATDPLEHPIATGLNPYLHTLLHAIGKNEGRRIYVETEQVLPRFEAT